MVRTNMHGTMCQSSMACEMVSAEELDNSTRVLDLSLHRTHGESNNPGRTGKDSETDCDQKEYPVCVPASWPISHPSGRSWSFTNHIQSVNQMDSITRIPSPEELLARTRALRTACVGKC